MELQELEAKPNITVHANSSSDVKQALAQSVHPVHRGTCGSFDMCGSVHEVMCACLSIAASARKCQQVHMSQMQAPIHVSIHS